MCLIQLIAFVNIKSTFDFKGIYWPHAQFSNFGDCHFRDKFLIPKYTTAIGLTTTNKLLI